MQTQNDRRDARAEAKRLLGMVLTDPGAALERVHRGLGTLRARIVFRRAEIGYRVNVLGHVRVVADGRLSIGDYVQFAGGMIPSEIVCGLGSEFVIGEGSRFNYGVVIDCRESIRIGRRCMFGSMSNLRDSSISKSGPVVIEDDVWVAHGAFIEPGVHIGARSVVSAGSVATTDVPPDSLAIGNPAESFPMGSDPPQALGKGHPRERSAIDERREARLR